jgi:hypothetical protein
LPESPVMFWRPLQLQPHSPPYSPPYSPPHSSPPELSSRTRSPGFGERVRDLLFGWRKTLRKVLPGRIFPLYQPDFLFSAPPLDLLFARYRVTNVRKLFAMNKPGDFVSGGKSRDESLPVFDHPPLEVVGYAGVQVSRPAGQDVNPISAAHFPIPESNSRSLTRSPNPGDRVRDDNQCVRHRWSGHPHFADSSHRIILRLHSSHH